VYIPSLLLLQLPQLLCPTQGVPLALLDLSLSPMAVAKSITHFSMVLLCRLLCPLLCPHQGVPLALLDLSLSPMAVAKSKRLGRELSIKVGHMLQRTCLFAFLVRSINSLNLD
jgi:hypothetical protein